MCETHNVIAWQPSAASVALEAHHITPRIMQDELARAVGKLPQDHFDSAMSLIVARHPELHPGSEDMVSTDPLMYSRCHGFPQNAARLCNDPLCWQVASDPL